MYTFAELVLMDDRNRKQSDYFRASGNAREAVEVARDFRNLNARLIAKNEILEEKNSALAVENERLKALVAMMFN